MAPQAKKKSSRSSRTVEYAQQRRDNETETREELTKQLPVNAFHDDFKNCGEFNWTTKVLIATLRFFDPDAKIPEPTYVSGTSSVEYNQIRRTNEITVRDDLENLVPDNFFTSEITDRGDFNPTTKVMTAASLHLKALLKERDDTKMSTSNMPDSEDTMVPSRSSAGEPGEIPDSEEEGLKYYMDESFAVDQEEPANSDEQSKYSRKDSPNATPNIDGTIEVTRNTFSKIGNDEMLTNLRAEQQNQDMGLNSSFPPLQPPKKALVQGRWELKLTNPKPAAPENEYIQALEQVTNRLVAKAQELVIVADGDESAYVKPLSEAHDVCIDTIAMFQGDLSMDDYRKKCKGRKARWAQEYGLEFED